MLNKAQRIEKVARATYYTWMADFKTREVEQTWEDYSDKEYFYNIAKAAITAYEEMLPNEEEIESILLNGLSLTPKEEAKQINKLIRGE